MDSTGVASPEMCGVCPVLQAQKWFDEEAEAGFVEGTSEYGGKAVKSGLHKHCDGGLDDAKGETAADVPRGCG